MRRASPMLLALLAPALAAQEELPPPSAPAEEAEYYRIEGLVIPPTIVLEAGSFLERPGGELLIGTRRGEIYSVRGHDGTPARPRYELRTPDQGAAHDVRMAVEIFGAAVQRQVEAELGRPEVDGGREGIVNDRD